MTDQDLLNDIQYRTLETPNAGASLDSALWTIPELISYLNERHRRFIGATRLWMRIASQPVAAGIVNFSLNDFGGSAASTDLVDIYRLAYLTQASESHELQRGDTWSYDHGPDSTWPTTSGIPESWSIVTEPTVTLRMIPASAQVGTLEAIFTGLGTALGNTGVAINIPDEFAPYLVWGVLADMLSKEGQAHDPARAVYCEKRFEEGIALALTFTENP